MQDYPRLRCSSGKHNSNKGTAGAIAGLCNRLLDVIVSDKVRSQRSFQSLTLLQNIKAGTNTAAGSAVWHTSGPLRAFVMSSHVAVRIFNWSAIHAWLCAHMSPGTPISHSCCDTINPNHCLSGGYKQKSSDARGSAEHGIIS